MANEISIETINANLISHAERVFGLFKVADLGTVAESFDYFLRNYITTVMHDYATVIVPGSQRTEKSDSFYSGAIDFSIAVLEDPVNYDMLLITFLIRGSRSRTRLPRVRTLQIATACRYRRIKVIFSAEVPIIPDLVLEIASGIIQTGSKWMEHSFICAAASIESSLARDLYSFIRAVIHRSDILESFWFVSVAKDDTFYLFDDTRAASALNVASKKATTLGLRPLSITSEMLTCRVPYKFVASREAIASGKCIDISLHSSKYRESESALVIAQNIMAGSDSVSIFPFVREGRAFLVATFSTKYRQFVEPILGKYKSDIVKRFRTYQGTLNRLVTAVKRNDGTLPYGKIGEFIGGFLKSFLE